MQFGRVYSGNELAREKSDHHDTYVLEMLTIADVIETLSGIRPSWAEIRLLGAEVNSRQVNSETIFLALPGEHVDGHDYIQDAFEHGAILAIVQKDLSDRFRILDLRKDEQEQPEESIELPFCIRVDDVLSALQKIARDWRRKLSARVVGITGSVGKSTTKEVVAEVLNQRYRTLKNPGNLNNEIGLPLTLLSLSEEHQRAVLEMGFYVPGEIAFLCDIAQPQVGVITNIGTVHAERAGSQEVIARGKAELVQALPAAPEGVAILNYDDSLVREMASQTQARVFYYGLDPRADLWADHVEGLGLDGIRLRIHFGKEIHYLRVPLIGRHSVQTILRAAAVGLTEDLTWQEIVDGLKTGKGQLRLIAVPAKNGALILDDTYNASPESMLAALNLLDELEGNKVAVLGDMLELGRYEQRGHQMVGIRAAEVVDELITVGERGRLIAIAARDAGLPASVIKEFSDKQSVIAHLKRSLSADDIVLIKGSRGIEMDQIVSALESRR